MCVCLFVCKSVSLESFKKFVVVSGDIDQFYVSALSQAERHLVVNPSCALSRAFLMMQVFINWLYKQRPNSVSKGICC